MKIRIFKGFWTRTDVEKNPYCLFVYGDNDAGLGLGGQAIIRGLPNTIGIPTKKYPNHHHRSFYSDDELEENKGKILVAVAKLKLKAEDYEWVVFPEDGLGTGLANLPTMAPKTYKFLQKEINALRKFVNLPKLIDSLWFGI